MKKYLLETFRFNDYANRQMLDKISSLPDKAESIKYFSHLVNSQLKWMARIQQDPAAITMSWWDPLYPLELLAAAWEESLTPWINYIGMSSEEDLHKELQFVGFDGGRWAASPVDIALQLNYHSIHHRAQIQILIREQGVEPDFIDYIGTRYRKIE